jgi:hypothetical protein
MDFEQTLKPNPTIRPAFIPLGVGFCYDLFVHPRATWEMNMPNGPTPETIPEPVGDPFPKLPEPLPVPLQEPEIKPPPGGPQAAR